MAKRVIISVTNDLSYDRRVHKTSSSLYDAKYNVILVGRKLKTSIPIKRKYKTKRMSLFFNKGALFYAEYNFRLFIFLLFSKVDILHSNDLDTLLANYLVSKIKKKPLIYDSHEYFTGVPEIQNKPFVKKVWTKIENWIFPKLKIVFTVNNSIAKLYKQKYGNEIQIIRNIPSNRSIPLIKNKKELKLPEDKKIIILQGAGINIDRGAEELLEAIALDSNLFLCIVGGGDVIEILKTRAKKTDLKDRLLFTGKLPYNEMMQYTVNADVGISLDKDTNINYRFSLPNKIFDYIKAEIPVVVSNLPEISNIINKYEVGEIAKNHQAIEILNAINKVLSNDYKNHIKIAKNELVWEKEVECLLNSYRNIEIT